MPILISKTANGVVQGLFTVNNFSNVTVDAGNNSDTLADLAGDERSAILIHTLGPTMQINFEYSLIDEASTVVSGSTVTTARDQMKYLYNTLMSTGATSYNDFYWLILQFSTTALDSGTASAGAASTLTDGSKSWTVNGYANQVVYITGGTGSGQVRNITSNTGTVLTVSDAWTTNPDNTSTYQILDAFGRKGFVNKITCQSAAEQPLSWRGNITFQVGTVV